MSNTNTDQVPLPPVPVGSLSTPVRKYIITIQKRLEVYLTEVGDLDLEFSVNKDLSSRENVEKLEELAHLLSSYINKIKTGVKILNEQNVLWGQLLKDVSPDRFDLENTFYEEWTSYPGNFLEVIADSVEAVNLLESKKSELHDFISTLQVQLGEKSASGVCDKVRMSDNLVLSPTVKLPKLQLPVFYGDPRKWMEFYDSFESAVHSQNIPNVQKFNYLLSSVKGAAYRAIEGMSVTNLNYSEALSILKSRFGDSQVLKRYLYADLRNIPLSGPKTSDLRTTVESIERVCRQLEALGEDLDQQTLVMMLLEKLPHSVLIELGKLKKPHDMWKIEELRKNLHDIIAIREEVQQISQSVHQVKIADQRKAAKSTNLVVRQQADTFAVPTASVQKPKNLPFSTENKKLYPCAFCQGNHLNDMCSNFKTVSARKKVIQEKDLCFRCLRPGHMAVKCLFTRPCSYCKGNHNRALCDKTEQKSGYQYQVNKGVSGTLGAQKIMPMDMQTNKVKSGAVVSNVQFSLKPDQPCPSTSIFTNQNQNYPLSVKLLLANVTVVNLSDPTIQCPVYVFFDTGSQRTYVTNALKDKLQLQPIMSEVIEVSTFAAKTQKSIKTSLVTFGLTLMNRSLKQIHASAVSHLVHPMLSASITADDVTFLKRSRYGPPPSNLTYSSVVQPDILIGMDYYFDFFENSETVKLPSGLVIVTSSLGLIVAGKQEKIQDQVIVHQVIEKMVQSSPVKCVEPDTIEKFWNLELIGVKDNPYVCDDDIALKHFNDTIKFNGERYEIQWSWKSGEINLPSNYGLSVGRLKTLLGRLKQDPELAKKYNETICDQITKGIVEPVFTETDNRKHYLPHHPVVTPHKTTTKVRIVFDASSKSKKSFNSLNDCLYKGPLLMPELCGVLLRFRTPLIAIIADIEKAFLQVGIQESDRDVVRFLWLKDPNNLDMTDNLQVFRFCHVPFGVISSPFILNATLKYHLNQISSPLSKNLARNLYVDNVVLGADSVNQCVEIYRKSRDIFASASMNLREWTSNLLQFNNQIPEENRLMSEETKVLGIHWNTTHDVLKLTIHVDDKKTNVLTKRSVLRSLATTFDPLGMLTPVLLNGKLYLQKLWKEKASWDTPLPSEFVTEWYNIQSDWAKNRTFFLSRQVIETVPDAEYNLVAFVDASKHAYAVAIYIQTQYGKFYNAQLIFSKTRLAPIKEVTLPRLELMAVTIGVKMIQFIEKEIDIPLSSKTLFSDSECVLHWISSAKPLSVFVENRVKEIKSVHGIAFRHVKGLENPADLATRSMSTNDLESSALWWKGPVWLSVSPEFWPTSNISPIPSSSPECLVLDYPKESVCPISESSVIPIDLSRVGSYQKALRIMVHVLRFIKQIVKFMKKEYKLHNVLLTLSKNGPIRADELNIAESILIKQTQRIYCEDLEQKGGNQKKLENEMGRLGVKLDENGVLRCCGRMKNAELADKTKFPILLPRKNKLTDLIILDKHRSLLHAGVYHTLSELRQTYWVPHGRAEVRRVLSQCFLCKRYAAVPYRRPNFPPFPKERVQKSRPFEFIGVDFFGPMKITYRNETVKIWGCIFTCLVTRAIHLEAVTNQSTESFLNCFRRFIARRGKPKKVMSDNAPQFQLTKKVFNRIWYNIITEPEVQAYFSKERILWNFITVYSPWKGGVYERMIGLVKVALKKSIGRQLLTYENLVTLLTEVEAVVNSRPLTYAPDQPDAPKVLRPIDFLIPQVEVGIPLISDSSDDPSDWSRSDSTQWLHEYWKETLKVLDKFWKLWHSEYLYSLRERTQVKPKSPHLQSKNIPKLNDVVLVGDEDEPRGFWRLGQIVEIIISSDEEIRSAKVRLPNQMIITRSINHLYPLEVGENNTEENGHQEDVECQMSSSTQNVNESVASDQTDNEQALTINIAVQSVNFKPFFFKCSNFLFFALTFLLWCFGCTKVNSIDFQANVCPANNSLIFVHSQTCVKTGVVVKQVKGKDRYCYVKITCPHGHLQEGKCGSKCPCPKWATDCSYYNITIPALPENYKEILKLDKPNICSYHPNPNCDPIPIHSHFSQIQLYDNSTHLVKNLQIIFSSPNSTQFLCFGNGLQTGTPEFCIQHKCHKRGTKFCYYSENEVVKYTNDDGQIPIIAWGVVPVTFYGHKQDFLPASTCSQCKLICVQGGVNISLGENFSVIEVCSSPYCYKIIQPRKLEVFQFPRDILVNKYEVHMKIWDHGYLIREISTQCLSAPYCEMIHCNFCFDAFYNPHCIPKLYIIFLLIFIYFLVVIIYLSLKILKLCCKTLLYCCYALCYYISALYPFFQKRKVSISESSESNISSSVEDVQKVLPKRTFSFKPSPRKFHLVIITSLFCLLVSNVSTCSEVVPFTAKSSVCTEMINGSMICTISEITRLSLVPQGQESCLLIKSENGAPLGTISLEVKRVSIKCNNKNDYFTRSFEIRTVSSKRCSGMGSCSGTKCEDVHTFHTLPELEGEANVSPGHTFCVESCGCAFCGCFFCDSACLFYRIYVTAISDTVFEVFSCPTWNFHIQIKLHIKLQEETSVHEFDLIPGVPIEWQNLQILMPTLITPPAPLLGSQFLTDGNRTAMIKASSSGQPVVGMVGDFQCSSHFGAKTLSTYYCRFPPSICKCDAQEKSVHCVCERKYLEDIFKKQEYVLPMTLQNLYINANGKNIEVEYNQYTAAEVQLSLQGFSLVTKTDRNQCFVKPIEFFGCYDCLTGAKLEYECTTDFGTALAHVTCGTGIFSTNCDQGGIKNVASMHFQSSIINTTCNVSCPGGISNFSLTGILIFVDKTPLHGLSNIVIKSNYSRGGINLNLPDIPSILSPMLSNWKFTIAAALIIIVVIFLFVAFGPAIGYLFCASLKCCLTRTCKKRKIHHEKQI